jgi:hypothetical protein
MDHKILNCSGSKTMRKGGNNLSGGEAFVLEESCEGVGRSAGHG